MVSFLLLTNKFEKIFEYLLSFSSKVRSWHFSSFGFLFGKKLNFCFNIFFLINRSIKNNCDILVSILRNNFSAVSISINKSWQSKFLASLSANLVHVFASETKERVNFDGTYSSILDSESILLKPLLCFSINLSTSGSWRVLNIFTIGVFDWGKFCGSVNV